MNQEINQIETFEKKLLKQFENVGYPAEEKDAYCSGGAYGAILQKEQDDVILRELILASFGASNFLQETGTVGSFLIDAIEKAKIHLKKRI